MVWNGLLSYHKSADYDTFVTFFSNDIATTPPDTNNEPCAEANHCVHELVKIRGWLGRESMHPDIIQLPAIFIA